LYYNLTRAYTVHRGNREEVTKIVIAFVTTNLL